MNTITKETIATQNKNSKQWRQCVKKRNLFYFLRVFLIGLSTLLFNFSMGIYLLETTKMGIPFALNIMLFNLPFIFIAPFFGKVCRRFPKKKLIVFSSFLNFLGMSTVLFLWNKIDNISLIYIGSLITSITTGISYLAFETGLPELFESEFLGKANSFAQMMACIGRIIGPLIGGILYSNIQIKSFVLLVVAMSFVVFIIDLILDMDNRRDKESDSENINKAQYDLNRVRDTLRFCVKDRDTLDIMQGFVIMNIVIFLIIALPVPYILKNDLKIGSGIYGLIFATGHMGGIIGAIFTLKREIKLNCHTFKKIFMGYLFSALLFMLPLLTEFGSKKTAFIYLVGMILSGITLGLLDISSSLYFQQNIRKEDRGAIVGILTCIPKLAASLTVVLSGKIVDLFSPKISMWVGIILLMLAIIYYEYKILNGKRENIEMNIS